MNTDSHLDRLVNWSQGHPWATAVVVCFVAFLVAGYWEQPH